AVVCSDERAVPPPHRWSNYAMADRALIGRLPKGRRPTVYRMPGEEGPDTGAAIYESLVRENAGHAPRWDLLLLGRGPDAHCASLFPSKEEWHERQRLIVGVEYAGMEPQVPRISMT